jgi:hypothetical protein
MNLSYAASFASRLRVTMGQKQLQIELKRGFNIKRRTRDLIVLTGCAPPSLVLEL